MSTKELTDEAILKELQEMAEDADNPHRPAEKHYEVLFQRYSSQLYNLSRYYGLCHDDSNEIIQESFIRLHNKLSYYNPEKPFKPYFFKIAFNIIRNKYRHNKRHSHGNIDHIENLNILRNSDFEEFLQNREYFECIINKLPKHLKDVFIAKIYGNLNMNEVAETLGISSRLVYYYYNEAVEIIKKETGDRI